MRAIWIAVMCASASVAVADDVPSVADAGGRQCTVGMEIVLGICPKDTESCAASFALTPSGGMVVIRPPEHRRAQPLAPDARPRGKPIALDGTAEHVVAAGDHFLALGPCANTVARGCQTARWLDATGHAGPEAQFVAESITKDAAHAVFVATRVDANGKATRLTGWPATAQVIATAPGARILVRTDVGSKTELIDLHAEPSGAVTERARPPWGRIPAPYVAHVDASTTGRDGVSLLRTMLFVDTPPETHLSGARSVTPSHVEWSGGAFYASYIEHTKLGDVLTVRAARCKSR